MEEFEEKKASKENRKRDSENFYLDTMAIEPARPQKEIQQFNLNMPYPRDNPRS